MNSPEQLFRRAEQIEDEGDVAGALRCWRALVKLRPNAESFCRLANAADELGNHDEAVEAYEHAIKLDPTAGAAYLGLACMRLDKGQNSEAVNLLRISLTHEENEVAYCLLGVALQRLGQVQESAQNFQRAVQIDPTYEEAYFNFALLMREQDTERSLALFSRAIECDPTYTSAHREFGFLLSKSGSTRDAEYHLRRAIELDPGDAWARVYLANHLWRHRDSIGALMEFKSAIEAAPGVAFPLWALADFYSDQAEWDTARKLYERALQAEPYNLVANINFGRRLRREGNISAAKIYLHRALSLAPNDSAARILLDEIAQQEADLQRRNPGAP